MECIAADVETFHLGVGDLDAFLVDPRVEDALNFEPCLGDCRRDEFDDGSVVCERPAAPVLRDAAEQAVWLEPSSAFRLTCREKPISMSSLRTLLGLIEWPMATSADASLSRLFDTHSSGRTGSPSVAGSTRRLRSSSSVASVSVNDRGPPPSRRTWPGASGGASRSFSPRPMVLRASPVTLDTAARPPHPAARASLAANNRRPRSSRFEPSASQRCRIARKSIMQTLVARSAPPRNRPPPSHKVAWPFTASPDSLIVVAVLS